MVGGAKTDQEVQAHAAHSAYAHACCTFIMDVMKSCGPVSKKTPQMLLFFLC